MSKKKSSGKKTEKSIYKIVERRDGRFLVKKRGKYVRGVAKVEVLVAAGKIKAMTPKAKADTQAASEPAAES